MIGVIDYGAGNIRSISRALTHAGAEVVVSSAADEIAAQDAIVLPGVGHAGQLIERLKELGMDRAISDAVDRGTPYLGICVGLQIIFGDQEEGGAHGLGLLPGRVRHVVPGVKAPHMGWNSARFQRTTSMGAEGDERFFYFVHSYLADGVEPSDIVATSHYGEAFPSIVMRDHIWGTQFHPEKSATNGLALISTFVDYVGERARQRELVASR